MFDVVHVSAYLICARAHTQEIATLHEMRLGSIDLGMSANELDFIGPINYDSRSMISLLFADDPRACGGHDKR